jgi:DNA-directed RNA polymerase sigma subunit (sigma70/sigma32)
MKVSCTLDAAEAGGMYLEDVAVAMNVTRERIRQLEASALRKLKGSKLLRQLLERT